MEPSIFYRSDFNRSVPRNDGSDQKGKKKDDQKNYLHDESFTKRLQCVPTGVSHTETEAIFYSDGGS